MTARTRLLAGTSGLGLTINAGTLLVAALAPADTADTRRWVAVQGLGLGATLEIPGATATVSSLDVTFNRATGGATPINWNTVLGTRPAHLTPVAVNVLAHQVTLTGDALAVSGDLTTVDRRLRQHHARALRAHAPTISLDLNNNGTPDDSRRHARHVRADERRDDDRLGRRRLLDDGRVVAARLDQDADRELDGDRGHDRKRVAERHPGLLAHHDVADLPVTTPPPAPTAAARPQRRSTGRRRSTSTPTGTSARSPTSSAWPAAR